LDFKEFISEAAILGSWGLSDSPPC